MNIAMFTNAARPIVGGLIRSIDTFAEDFRQMGHRVLIVTLSLPGCTKSDDATFRLPAYKGVAGTPYSVRLPVPSGLRQRLDEFAPDVIHSHHPFMLGDTALRVARRRGLPMIFTHHTLYEQYTYLFAPESEVLKRIARTIATEYANLCDRVIAPTGSIEAMIRKRGVHVPISIIPTGVDVNFFAGGDGRGFRRKHNIPEEAFVAGYLGRVVEAKNIHFLAAAVSSFLQRHDNAWFLVVGEGDAADSLRATAAQHGVEDRLVMPGSIEGPPVAQAYAAMNVFTLASRSETQGIVLIESFSAGVPVVALDGPGTRDIVQSGENGCLLPGDVSTGRFAEEMERLHRRPEILARWSENARRRAQEFDRRRCADKLLQVYGELPRTSRQPHHHEPQLWDNLQERFAAEWDLFKEKIATLQISLSEHD